MHDPWLTEISPDDIEAAMQRKAAREALIVEQAAEITRLRGLDDGAVLTLLSAERDPHYGWRDILAEAVLAVGEGKP